MNFHLSLPEENLSMDIIVIKEATSLAFNYFSVFCHCLPKYEILSIYFFNRAMYILCRNIFYFLISYFSNLSSPFMQF